MVGASSGSSGPQGGTSPGQNAVPLQGMLTHTPLTLGPCRHANLLFVHSFGLWECTEKTHTDMGSTCKTHMDSGPGQELIDFFFFFGHQFYNETMLLEDLLYSCFG